MKHPYYNNFDWRNINPLTEIFLRGMQIKRYLYICEPIESQSNNFHIFIKTGDDEPDKQKFNIKNIYELGDGFSKNNKIYEDLSNAELMISNKSEKVYESFFDLAIQKIETFSILANQLKTTGCNLIPGEGIKIEGQYHSIDNAIQKCLDNS